MQKQSIGKSDVRPSLKLKLTEGQQADITRFIAASGRANLELEVAFVADVKHNTIAASTVLVGNAV